MRGHIKKRVLLRRRKRYRRRRWIREFKPIIRQNPQDCFIEKLYPKTGIFINNYILRFNNLTFLRSFNLIYRYDSYFSFKFFFYKLMFDINRYFFFRQQLILKNIRLVNLKWATPILRFREGRDDFIYTESPIRTSISKISTLFYNFFRRVFKLAFKSLRNFILFRKHFVCSNRSLLYLHTFRQFFIYRRLRWKTFQHAIVYLKIIYINLGKKLGGLRGSENKRYAGKIQGHFSERLLKYKLHGLFIYINRWSRMIRIQLHTKTQIKLTHVDDFLTFSPNKSLCMNNFSGVRNLLVSLHFINTVVFRHTIRFNFLQNRLCNSTRMLHDFVFLEHAADADSEKFYLKKLEEFNKIAKELTKHIRKKHDITIYSHLDIKFFWGFFFSMGDRLVKYNFISDAVVDDSVFYNHFLSLYKVLVLVCYNNLVL